jgi:hypothetical protein
MPPHLRPGDEAASDLAEQEPDVIVRYEYDDDQESRAAAAILEPYVGDVCRAYDSYGFGDLLSGLKVKITDEARENDRNFAACRDDGKLILLAPQMTLLPVETAVGIIFHEMGHAADSVSPARVAFDKHGDVILIDTKGGLDEEHLKSWRNRDRDEVEVTADRIGSAVLSAAVGFKTKIGYRSVCPFGLLQTLDARKNRPKGLRL